MRPQVVLVKTGISFSAQNCVIWSTHSRRGVTLSARFPVSAPRITHWGRPSAALMSTGPSSGSMDQKLLIATPCIVYMAAASSLATVDPYQKLFSCGSKPM